MSLDRPNSTVAVAVAMAEAARFLPPDDPLAHVFFEDRQDVRLTIDHEGRCDRSVTRTRGAAVGGRRAFHFADPDLSEGKALVEGSSEGSRSEWPTSDEPPRPSLAQRPRTRLPWRARLVEFDQKIWVGRRDGVVEDRRRSRRLAVRIGDGLAEADFVLDPAGTELPSSLIDEAAARLSTVGTRWAGPPDRPFVAIFAPGVAGVLAHELFGHALEGDVALRRPTWIQGLDRPASAPLNVIDDPTLGRAAWTCDDEGTEAKPVALIERGAPAGLVLDRAWAARAGRPSTGHGRRASYLDPIRPRLGCTMIMAGPDHPDQIVRATRDGVFIARLIAGHTEPESGRATFVVSEARRIGRGLLLDPISPFMIRLDGPEVWRSIEAIGTDLTLDACVGSCIRDGQPMAVSVGAPTIRLGVAKVLG